MRQLQVLPPVRSGAFAAWAPGDTGTGPSPHATAPATGTPAPCSPPVTLNREPQGRPWRVGPLVLLPRDRSAPGVTPPPQVTAAKPRPLSALTGGRAMTSRVCAASPAGARGRRRPFRTTMPPPANRSAPRSPSWGKVTGLSSGAGGPVRQVSFSPSHGVPRPWKHSPLPAHGPGVCLRLSAAGPRGRGAAGLAAGEEEDASPLWGPGRSLTSSWARLLLRQPAGMPVTHLDRAQGVRGV